MVLLIAPEEVGLPVGHPEESRVDLVCGQPSAQLLNVFGVSGFQGGFVKYPVLISWEKREGKSQGPT